MFGMRVRWCWAVALGAAAGLSAPSARAQELRCVFDVTKETVTLPPLDLAGAAEPGANPAPAPAPAPAVAAAPKRVQERYRATVSLARDYITWEDRERGKPPEVVTYHFGTRRVVRVDPAARTFRDDSLYGVVSFRVNELLHRVGVAASLLARDGGGPEGGKPDDPPARSGRPLAKLFGRFASESLFSLRVPAAAPPSDLPDLRPPVIRTVPRPGGKGWDFTYEGQTVVKFEPSERALPAPYRRSLRQYLTYACSIHPDVRDKILDSGRVPDSLTYGFTDAAGPVETTVTLRLAGLSDDERPWAGVPAGFTRALEPSDPLDRILRKPRPAPPATLADRAALDRFVAEATKQNHWLDAYLGWCEYTARTGDPAADVGDALRRTRDPVLTAFTRTPAPTPAGVDRKLREYDAVDRTGLTRGFMIDALSGSLLTVVGRPDDAEPRLLRALDGNPELVSVYVLLGTNRFQAYRTVDAWRCFDAARRVAPGSPLLADVDALESRFLKDFAEEF